jgi:hypothetical protein
MHTKHQIGASNFSVCVFFGATIPQYLIRVAIPKWNKQDNSNPAFDADFKLTSSS